jgi:hypothetical protein
MTARHAHIDDIDEQAQHRLCMLGKIGSRGRVLRLVIKKLAPSPQSGSKWQIELRICFVRARSLSPFAHKDRALNRADDHVMYN